MRRDDVSDAVRVSETSEPLVVVIQEELEHRTDLTTAYITLSTTGRLVKTTWPRPGLALEYLNT